MRQPDYSGGAASHGRRRLYTYAVSAFRYLSNAECRVHVAPRQARGDARRLVHRSVATTTCCSSEDACGLGRVSGGCCAPRLAAALGIPASCVNSCVAHVREAQGARRHSFELVLLICAPSRVVSLGHYPRGSAELSSAAHQVMYIGMYSHSVHAGILVHLSPLCGSRRGKHVGSHFRVRMVAEPSVDELRNPCVLAPAGLLDRSHGSSSRCI